MKTLSLIPVMIVALGLGVAGCGDDGGESAELPSGCGDSFAYSDDDGYAPLAGVLADDVLLVDMSQPRANCAYLGIEAGVASACGGRTLEDDVIDASYGVLAAGDPNAGIGDGVDGNPEGAFDGSFPYLLPPN